MEAIGCELDSESCLALLYIPVSINVLNGIPLFAFCPPEPLRHFLTSTPMFASLPATSAHVSPDDRINSTSGNSSFIASLGRSGVPLSDASLISLIASCVIRRLLKTVLISYNQLGGSSQGERKLSRYTKGQNGRPVYRASVDVTSGSTSCSTNAGDGEGLWPHAS